VNNAGDREGLGRNTGLGATGAYSHFIFSNLRRPRILAEVCHRKFLQDVSQTNNPSAFLDSEEPNVMTALEIYATGAVLLLFPIAAIATWALVTGRKRAPRNWNFKERSLQYLNEVDRNRRDISAAHILDQEMAEH
jgi:hypothetical protein